MDKSKSVLEFIDYTVDKILFEKNNSYDKEETELSIKFNHGIKKEADLYYVNMTVNIFSDKDISYNECPFKMEVSLTGIFKLEDCVLEEPLKEKLINENTIAILFPYLRSLISTITSNSNINPLILPPVNIIAMLENESGNE